MADGDDSDESFDPFEFALDIIAPTNCVIVFPDRFGPEACVGHHRGRWVMAYEHADTDDCTALSVSRDKVVSVLRDDHHDVTVENGYDYSAWLWLTHEGFSDSSVVRGQCMCGQFKYSTDANVVQRWVRNHRSECYSTPRVQIAFDDID